MKGTKIFVAMVLLALVGVGASLNWRRISIDGLQGALNDQVGYIAVARHWADGEGLQSSYVYPSLLRQKVTKSTLYMPGFYWTLGLAFKVFGYSTVTARIPSLLGYLLACALTWWIARRVYGDGAALVASALFAFFPMCLIFAFTAMAEMVVVAAGLSAVGIFLWGIGWDVTTSDLADSEQGLGNAVMVRRGMWIAPLAVILPLLFRETGVTVGLIMLTVLMGASGVRRWRIAMSVAALMAIAIVSVLISPIATGRPSLWKANILAGGDPQVLYSDAYGMEQLPSKSMDWAHALRGNFLDNARNLLWTTEDSDGWTERTAIWFLLSGIPLGVYLSARKRDWFARGVTIGVAVLLLADLSCYDVWGYRGVRALLVMEPFVAMLWGRLIANWLGNKPGKQLLFAAVAGLVGVLSALLIWRGQREADAGTVNDLAFMESIAPASGRLLVSPFDISLGYVHEHYPERWAFFPSDCRSLQLLNARDEVGTLVVRVGEAPQEMLNGCGLPLRFEGERDYRGTRYRVFRR
jgi:hypothetical protein